MLQVVKTKTDLQTAMVGFRKAGKSVGLVPTMGALHKGHMSLIEMSRRQYDVTVVSIFVNPTQFNNSEDLSKYPRAEQDDITALNKVGCDLVFIPSEKEVYKQTPSLKMSFGHLEHIMEGKFRPNHFSGVGLVVMKLFGLVQPNGAFFGQKDIQQFKIISVLVNDLDVPVRLHMAPIIRNNGGLALSSRNARLSSGQKEIARSLYSTLKLAAKAIKEGQTLIEANNIGLDFIKRQTEIELEYFEIVGFETLQKISTINKGDRIALCIAGKIAGVRLIDNVIVDV